MRPEGSRAEAEPGQSEPAGLRPAQVEGDELVIPHSRKDHSCGCGQAHCVDCGEVYPCSRRHSKHRTTALITSIGGWEHARRNPGHRVTESLEDPWFCRDCGERAAIYDLRVSDR